jgi:hypothetical protein
LLASGAVSCAKVGSPTGGPKDVTPPLLTGSIPQMAATGFAGEEIIINFNEYIQLRDVYNEVLISAPSC